MIKFFLQKINKIGKELKISFRKSFICTFKPMIDY